MDTVHELGFTLRMIRPFPVSKESTAILFFKNPDDVWKSTVPTLSAEENEDLDILFSSADPDARLYLEALDIIPTGNRDVRVDERGLIYRRPCETPFTLYKNRGEYDGLRVDLFRITVFCHGQWYYGSFQILPKQLSPAEWRIMRDDLENEIRGLAQDIARRNVGIGTLAEGSLPPEIFYNFLVIRKYARKVLSALMEIAENPRSEIITQYQTVPASNTRYTYNAETVKRYVMRSGAEATVRVPIKAVNYDIQDNRLLRMVMLDYEKKLQQFIDVLEGINDAAHVSNGQQIGLRRFGIEDFCETAYKLRKLTGILRTKEWFRTISDIADAHIPHSFILDARYNILYQMYMDLRKKQMEVDFDPEFSYTWKRSSKLYEMWCFVKVCRILGNNYGIGSTADLFISDKVLFPYLKSGTVISFEEGDLRLDVTYDGILPRERTKTTKSYPLYVARNHTGKSHNRPDILINMFIKSNEWYIGSIVLECKYRKLNSFWFDTAWSSRAQLESYYNNARSQFLYGQLGSIVDARPVKEIIVFTPDSTADGTEQSDFHIHLKNFKPSENIGQIASVEKTLIDAISKAYQKALEIRSYSV